MWKIMARVAAGMIAALLLLGGTAQAAETAGTGHPKSTNAATEQGTGETRAIVVGAVAFVLMVGTGGAVLWYTARERRTTQ